MDDLPLIAEKTGLLQEWFPRNITTTFFKCTRWQLEETTDLLNCPFHYFCDSSYAGNFPPAVDLSVLSVVAASFLSAVTFTAMEFKTRGESFGRRNLKRRYFLPSGPVVLPLMLLALAKGQRINTMFPLSQLGPSILLLIHVSALAFENKADQRSISYAVMEASTVSGILHASLYLDSIILPYYTGLDALSRSIFSGECPSCVCRKEDLVVGGRLVTYRGSSKTTMFVIVVLCSRMLSRISGEEKFSLVIKMLVEVISWVSVAVDTVYLMISIPHESLIQKAVIYGGICVLILFNVFRKMQRVYGWLSVRHDRDGKKYVGLSGVEIL